MQVSPSMPDKHLELLPTLHGKITVRWHTKGKTDVVGADLDLVVADALIRSYVNAWGADLRIVDRRSVFASGRA